VSVTFSDAATLVAGAEVLMIFVRVLQERLVARIISRRPGVFNETDVDHSRYYPRRQAG
jgi:hypothetical protein